jgi:hypothetical protein
MPHVEKNTYDIISHENFCHEVKKSIMYKNMNETNKKSVNIWVDKGAEEALKYLFTYPITGKNLLTR